MSGGPIMLAIETSQHTGGVAIGLGDGTCDAEPLRAKSRHDDDLLPAIDRLLRRRALRPGHLEAVAVSIGPGGFTGLRISTATARMFAETLSVRLVAVPTALVAAEPCDETAPLLVALAAKRETAWCTRVERAGGDWAIAGEPGLAGAEALELGGVELVLADQHLPQPMRQRCIEAGIPVREPRFDPICCLRAGERLLRAARATDPDQLRPLYPRAPEAVSLWERRCGR